MRKSDLVVAWIACLIPLAAEGAALPEAPGRWFIAPQISYYTTDHYWNKDGASQSLGSYGPFIKKEVSVYGEYGWDRDNTITFKTAIDALQQNNPGRGLQQSGGFTGFDIGMIHNVLLSGPYALSVYGQMLLPNGQRPAQHVPLVGYGRFGLEGGVLFGGYFNAVFFDTGLGYRAYIGYPSNQVRAYVTTGVNLASSWQGLISAYGDFGTNSGATFSSGNVILQPYYQLVQVSVGVRYRLISGFSVVPNVTLPVWGRNTGQGYSVGMSLWTDF
ncbi:hypothetical protein [Acidithiobacillus sulfuriphilus]|uniref:hypothetical protein n=1 Tax=Acidithiobacillus sulfuriphilus TaxID=1867749 RepID=UPI003F5FDF26